MWRHMTVLALAALGVSTKNRNDPICVTLPKVDKAKKEGDVSLWYRQQMLQIYISLI